MGYSHSDHHHSAQRPPTSRDMLNLPSKKSHKRMLSEYSILNDEHLYSKHSFYETPSSEVSYDPFRASKQAVLPNEDLHQNITVHRGTSSGSRRTRPATALVYRTGSSLRIQALTKSNRGSVMTRTFSKRSTPSQRSRHPGGSSASRSSMTSSFVPSSPPVYFRPSSYKRGVSFSHLRRNSVATGHSTDTAIAQHTPESHKYSTYQQDSARSSLRSRRPSTVGESPSVRPLSKIAARPMIPRLRVRKPESPSKYIQSEARKVSTELEKHMDEAFNRSSVGSSIRTSTTFDPRKDVTGCETPPTTFSNRGSDVTGLGTPDNKALYQHRPLPPVPDETPNTFLQRKLAETRAEIACRLGESGDSTEHFAQVIENLDRLMVPTIHVAKRASSAPAKSPEPPAPLQVIPEEGKEDRFEPYSSNYRAFTDPVRLNGGGSQRPTDDSTIRVVEQSPAHVAPLTIRKKSETSRSTKSENVTLAVPWAGPMRHTSAPSRQQAETGIFVTRTNPAATSNQVPETQEKKDTTIRKKKSLWFLKIKTVIRKISQNLPLDVSLYLKHGKAWTTVSRTTHPKLSVRIQISVNKRPNTQIEVLLVNFRCAPAAQPSVRARVAERLRISSISLERSKEAFVGVSRYDFLLALVRPLEVVLTIATQTTSAHRQSYLIQMGRILEIYTHVQAPQTFR